MGKKLTETLVGIFVLVGFVIFVLLFIWLSGRIGLRNTYDVTVHFNDVTGLRMGDPVMVFGIEKGKVKALHIDRQGVVTILAIDRKITLPEDSKIVIQSVSYLGADRYVRIFPGQATKTSNSFIGVNQTLDLESIAGQIDTLVNMLKDVKLPDLNKVTNNLSQQLDKSTQKFSEVLKGPADKIEDLAVSLDSLSALLKGNGSVGKLLKSDEMYQEVRETNQALKDLIKDIKENPKKYITIKVF